MRVLVAGGAGFVGSNLCAWLLDRGHSVVCIDNFLTGSLENVVDLLDRPTFTLIRANVVETPYVDVDVVMHLASPASPVDYMRYPLETLDANSNGTRRLLDVAHRASARFLYTSTSEIYGDPLIHPQVESYWGNVDPVGPRSCYDEGKRFGEAIITAWRKRYATQAAIVRIFNTYGPYMRMNDGRVVPELLGAALDGRPLVIHGDGSQTRSFMYVLDLVTALGIIAEDRNLDGLIVNIGNPHEVTIFELAEKIARLVRSPFQIVRVEGRDGDPQRRKPDISRITERYGWTPRVSLDEGLRETLAWVQSRLPAPVRTLEVAQPWLTEQPA